METWEEYLDLATSQIVNKYHARRVQAQLRHQLLTSFQDLLDQGLHKDAALTMAMTRMGDAHHLAQKVAEPDRQQRGWLLVFAVVEFVFGLGIIAVSYRTEFIAAMVLGRIVAVWGFLSTGIHSIRQQGLLQNLQILRRRWRLWLGAMVTRDTIRMTTVGVIAGGLAALLGAVPWSVVSNNTIDPVLTTEVLSVMLISGAFWGPWLLLRRWIGGSFFSVTLQAWASLSATASYLMLISWHAGLIPPPLFNWDPALFMTGMWMFSFVSLRSLTFIIAIRERFPWTDQRIRV